MIADQILELAQRQHIPVLGFGPVSEMAGKRTGHQPQDLLPGAQSVICFGLPVVPEGVYRASTYTLETVWRARNLNSRRLDNLSMLVAGLLEEGGKHVVPIYACQLMWVNDRGQVVGYLNRIEMGRPPGETRRSARRHRRR